jgi:hypothetical protein
MLPQASTVLGPVQLCATCARDSASTTVIEPYTVVGQVNASLVLESECSCGVRRDYDGQLLRSSGVARLAAWEPCSGVVGQSSELAITA